MGKNIKIELFTGPTEADLQNRINAWLESCINAVFDIKYSSRPWGVSGTGHNSCSAMVIYGQPDAT